MNHTPTIPTPKERFLADKEKSTLWAERLLSPVGQEIINEALLDYILGLPCDATTGLVVKGAKEFARHLAMFGVPRTTPSQPNSMDLVPFDPQTALEIQYKGLRDAKTSTQPKL